MARSLNQVTLMGNLTRDPELRQTPTGQNVTSFSLALNRAYKDQSGEWQEVTDYIDIVCWGPLAERVAQYLSKGRRCLVQGRIQSRSWEQDGAKRSKVEVLANDVTFLDSRGAGGDDGGSAGGSESSSAPKASDKPKAGKKANAKAKDDVVIEDIGDEPINLDDIPF
ncbi:single-stranded DNA-binding protein [Candidatus Saccharibacteria bacterium CG_4_10_14_0_2_um_filter_52_9]|nr:MAG: single-stranded DNA-binding protein [Candidatus Saccharibacteria bacterium CG_4_10_14_0_2_um_filter_52_9]